MNESGHLIVADAAAQLGVSAQRVRALLAAGDLSGELVGRVWLIDPHSLARHRHMRQPGAGRALAPTTAWAALLSAFAADMTDELVRVFGIVDERRSRILALRRRDAGDWRWLARRRAAVHRFSTRAAYVARISADSNVVAAGLSANGGSGFDPDAEAFDAYTDAATTERLIREYRLRPDGAGNLTLRTINLANPQQLAVVRSSPLPQLVVAVDLLEDRDPRTAAAGRKLFLQTLSETRRRS
jgi:hypothetical protein